MPAGRANHFLYKILRPWWKSISQYRIKTDPPEAVSIFVVKSKQSNAAPHLRSFQEISPLPWEETMPAMLPGQRAISCLTPRPMTVVFGLGTRLCVHMRTRLENGVLRNGQQPGSAMNIFIDQDKVEAMKILNFTW